MSFVAAQHPGPAQVRERVSFWGAAASRLRLVPISNAKREIIEPRIREAR